MSKPLAYGKEYAEAIAPYAAAMAARPKAAVHDVDSRRAMIKGLLGPALAALPQHPNTTRQNHTIPSFDGHDMIVYHTALDTAQASAIPTPAILHAHGGGMIIGEAELWCGPHSQTVAATGVQIFSADYRVAPEHPHPAPVRDAYAALEWLVANAKKFNVDPARIAVMGESAGGGIAAGVALMARDKGLEPGLAKQILVYPMLDDRNIVAEDHKGIEKFAVWSTDDSVTGWTALLGKDVVGTEKTSEYASPARAKSVEGLPAAYIDVGELDIFRDEDMEYARRLVASGVSVEFHLYPGVPHGWELFSMQTSVTKRAMENRMRAMMDF